MAGMCVVSQFQIEYKFILNQLLTYSSICFLFVWLDIDMIKKSTVSICRSSMKR